MLTDNKGYAYDYHAFLYRINSSAPNHVNVNTDALGASMNTNIEYAVLLSSMRKELAENHTEELHKALGSKDGEELMKSIIIQKLTEGRYHVDGINDPTILVDKLYSDMFEFSFITKYLQDPEVQSIKANRWDDIVIYTKDGWHKAPPQDRFLTPTQAIDVTKRMASLGGLSLDGAIPSGDSYITEGVRIHAKIAPVIDTDDAVQFAIRKQRRERFEEDEFISRKTASKEMLEFLKVCAKSNVSIGICGNVGAGKTTDVAWLLGTIPNTMQIYTIEDTRELDIRKTENGKILNNVMYTKTRYSSSKDGAIKNVNARSLVSDSLRCDSDIIVPAEMRGAEAIEVIEAAMTGHTIISTFHANNARDAYSRIVTMAMMAGMGYSETMLNQLAHRYFPIICHKCKMPDGTRKYVEISESVEIESGKYEVRPLYRFIVTESKYDICGNLVSIEGRHEKVGCISDGLASRLILKGVSPEVVMQYARQDFDPERSDIYAV